MPFLIHFWGYIRESRSYHLQLPVILIQLRIYEIKVAHLLCIYHIHPSLHILCGFVGSFVSDSKNCYFVNGSTVTVKVKKSYYLNCIRVVNVIYSKNVYLAFQLDWDYSQKACTLLACHIYWQASQNLKTLSDRLERAERLTRSLFHLAFCLLLSSVSPLLWCHTVGTHCSLYLLLGRNRGHGSAQTVWKMWLNFSYSQFYPVLS